MNNLSQIFRNLPVGDAVKNKKLTFFIKEKAAWYACLVNPNIDVLLLSDYLETRQSRNILLKKETDQYQAILQNFNELRSIVSNTGIYENILSAKGNDMTEFDLFSRQEEQKEKCPEKLMKLFNQWLIERQGDSELEKLIYQFCDWHRFNNFCFTGQRHFISWFNFQLWKLYGDAALLINFENYFYHHWNRESHGNVKSVIELTDFLQHECSVLKANLQVLYREEIGYSSLEPELKIVNNFIYHTGFDFRFNNMVRTDDYSGQLNRIMMKKGFVRSTDITFKVLPEKVKLTLQNWYNTGLVNVVFRENYWFASIIPSMQKPNRLEAYNNIKFNVVEPDWDQALVRPVIPIQPKIKVEEELPKKVSRQKAFFG